jgi:uncharacterized protein
LRAPETEAFFLQADRGYRFCLFHRCSGSPRGAVLFVHAFAEEMNKSRRMAALQARALAQAGFDVLQIDLLGCGDSSGDFEDAAWEDWLEDLRLGSQALAARSGAPQWLWGHRTGSLLAGQFARNLERPARLLFWHPVTDGRRFLNQFLRMRLLGQTDPACDSTRMDTRSLRAALAGGKPVEIGGYVLSPNLFAGLDRAVLHAPPAGSTVCWLDVVHAADAPAAGSTQLLQAWSQQGVSVIHQAVVGPPFWQTQEITQCEPLIAQTLQALRR